MHGGAPALDVESPASTSVPTIPEPTHSPARTKEKRQRSPKQQQETAAEVACSSQNLTRSTYRALYQYLPVSLPRSSLNVCGTPHSPFAFQ